MLPTPQACPAIANEQRYRQLPLCLRAALNARVDQLLAQNRAQEHWKKH
jgi:hypothetical protein